MKKVALVALFAVLLVGVAFAQQERPVLPVHQTNTYDIGGQQSRIGAKIWTNDASSGWFNPWDDQYIQLDWGILADQGTGTLHEVIDGFGFGYASDNQGNSVIWTMWFFDSCTGFNDPTLTQCGGFYITGLPGGITGPGTYWGWIVTLNLEGSGFEFLMGQQVGIGHEKTLAPNDTNTGGSMTLPPGLGGNSQTGTDDVFDILYPVSTWTAGPKYYVVVAGGNSWWFNGYPPIYASFSSSLYGPQTAGVGMNYGGAGAGGNDVGGFYATGTWAPGGSTHFMLKEDLDNGLGNPPGNANGKIHWNNSFYGAGGFYIPTWDLTLFPVWPSPVQFAAPFTADMQDVFTWDLEVFDTPPLGGIAAIKSYSQGLGVYAFVPGSGRASTNAILHN
jgi:hypothetical protein